MFQSERVNSNKGLTRSRQTREKHFLDVGAMMIGLSSLQVAGLGTLGRRTARRFSQEEGAGRQPLALAGNEVASTRSGSSEKALNIPAEQRSLAIAFPSEKTHHRRQKEYVNTAIKTGSASCLAAISSHSSCFLCLLMPGSSEGLLKMP